MRMVGWLPLETALLSLLTSLQGYPLSLFLQASCQNCENYPTMSSTSRRPLEEQVNRFPR